MERQLLPDDHLTEAVHHLVEEAVLLAGGHAPDARHLLLAILKTHAPTVQQLLPNINLDALTEAVQHELENPSSQIAIPYEAIIELAIRIAEREQRAQVNEVHLLKAIALLSGLIPRESLFPAPPALLQIGTNLTEQARQGALPRVVGREAEIALLTETLCRPVNPYAVLVGLEGVGRRAVVQGQGVLRARARVPEWQTEVEFEYDPDFVTPEIIAEAFSIAGRVVGIGDYRPRCPRGKGGPFGRFSVEVIR